MNFLLKIVNSGVVDNINGSTGSTPPAPSGVVGPVSDATVNGILSILGVFFVGVAVGIIGSILVRLFIKYTNPIDIPDEKKEQKDETKEGE